MNDHLPLPEYLNEVQRAAIERLLIKRRSSTEPGGTCSIIIAGQCMHQACYGLANLEHRVPIGPDSVFYVGSGAKQFTAACIALLCLEGKLRLTDDIRIILPEICRFKERITVGDLIHHTSGIRDFWELLPLTGWKPNYPIGNNEVLTLISTQRDLNHTPDRYYVYSNSNYVLLAEIVQRVSGETFPGFAKSRLFAPAGMEHTQFEWDAREVVPGRVASYAPKDLGLGFWQYVKSIEVYGPGNMLTTTTDLVRWEQFIYRHRQKKSALAQMLGSTRPLADGNVNDYGFGVVHGRYRGFAITSHGAGHMGFRTQSLRFPTLGLAINILSNLSTANPTTTAQLIAEILLGNRKGDVPSGLRKPSGPIIALPPRFSSLYQGIYTCRVNVSMSVRIVSRMGGLAIENDGGAKYDLFFQSETEGYVPALRAWVTLHFTGNRVSGLTYRNKNHFYLEKIVEPRARASPVACVGEYYNAELGAYCEVRKKPDGLVMQITNGTEKKLEWRYGRVFRCDKSHVVFQAGRRGKIAALTYSSSRLLHLHFTKLKICTRAAIARRLLLSGGTEASTVIRTRVRPAG